MALPRSNAQQRRIMIVLVTLAFPLCICDNQSVNPEATLEAAASPSPKDGIVAPTRQTSVDVYRGFVMFLMMAEVLRVCRVSRGLPGMASGNSFVITRR